MRKMRKKIGKKKKWVGKMAEFFLILFLKNFIKDWIDFVLNYVDCLTRAIISDWDFDFESLTDGETYGKPLFSQGMTTETGRKVAMSRVKGRSQSSFVGQSARRKLYSGLVKSLANFSLCVGACRLSPWNHDNGGFVYREKFFQQKNRPAPVSKPWSEIIVLL